MDSDNNKLNLDPNLDPNQAATLEGATLTLENADSQVVREFVTLWESTQILTTLLDLSNAMAMAELFVNNVME